MSLASRMKAVFQENYPSSDSVLPKAKMVDLLTHLDPSWTEDELDTLFSIADKDGNGVIDYNEFVDFICFMDGDGEKVATSEQDIQVGTHVKLISSKEDFIEAFRNLDGYEWDDAMESQLGKVCEVLELSQGEGVFGIKEAEPDSGYPIWWYPFTVIERVVSPWQLGKAFKEEVLDKVVVAGDYAIMGATMLGRKEMEEWAAPFPEKEEGYKIACIVDVGRPELFMNKYLNLGCDEGSEEIKPMGGALKDKKIDMWIVLMPGTDSDPSCMGSSFGISMQIPTYLCSKYGQDDTVQIRFVHRDYYFGLNSMMTFQQLFALDEPDIKVIPESKRGCMIDWLKSWHANVWTIRGTISYGVGWGIEEGQMIEGYDLMLKSLLDSRAFNSEMPEEIFDKGDFPEEPNFVAYPQAAVRFAYGENVFLHQKDMDAWKYGGKLELFDLEKSHNVTEWDEAGADIYFFLDVKDLTLEFVRNGFVRMRESEEWIDKKNPLPIIIVLLVEDISDFGKVPNLSISLAELKDNLMMEGMIVFATYSEVELVGSVFLRETYPNAMALMQSMVIFPGIMMFTLLSHDGTTLKQELADSSLLFCSLKYGKDAPTVPAAKLGPRSLMRKGEEAIHFQTVPGDSKATVIQPVDILQRILSMAQECPIENEDELVGEECKSILEDTKSELQQYSEAPVPDDGDGDY